MSSQARRILIIDDQADQRLLGRMMLTRAGFEVDTAESAEDGLDLAQKRSFDAVLVDFFLPGKNGIELASALRRLPGLAARPIVMLSSENDEGLRELGLRAGIDSWLCKPIRAEDLVTTLQRLFGIPPDAPV